MSSIAGTGVTDRYEGVGAAQICHEDSFSYSMWPPSSLSILEAEISRSMTDLRYPRPSAEISAICLTILEVDHMLSKKTKPW
jgi:hypothetical protein